METKAILVLLLPIVSLVLILAWSWLIITKRDNMRINLKGFGITITLDNQKKGSDEEVNH